MSARTRRFALAKFPNPASSRMPGSREGTSTSSTVLPPISEHISRPQRKWKTSGRRRSVLTARTVAHGSEVATGTTRGLEYRHQLRDARRRDQRHHRSLGAFRTSALPPRGQGLSTCGPYEAKLEHTRVPPSPNARHTDALVATDFGVSALKARKLPSPR